MQFCKRLLGVKKCTQNDFVYGELGRCPMRNYRMYNIVKYWTKIILCDNKRNIKIVYNMLCEDILDGNVKLFLMSVQQRLKNQFLQNCCSPLDNSSRAGFYKHFAVFMFQPYLDT